MCFKVAVDEGSQCAKRVKREIQRLSGFKLEATDPTVEKGYDEAYKDEHKLLDYYVLHECVRIAMLDVSCVRYQLLDWNARHYSKIMPVAAYKGLIATESKLPIFIMYLMLYEQPYGMPLKNCCVWIKGEDVVNAPRDVPEGAPSPEDKANYYTDIKRWHRGLDCLIAQFNALCDASARNV
jgi:hypothetical protein